MTIKIWDDEFIVGNRCTKFVGTPLYPEVRVDTIEQDLDLYSTRDVQKILISEEDKRILKDEIIPYWKNEEDTVKSRFYSYLSPKLKDLIFMLLYIVDTHLKRVVIDLAKYFIFLLLSQNFLLLVHILRLLAPLEIRFARHQPVLQK